VLSAYAGFVTISRSGLAVLGSFAEVGIGVGSSWSRPQPEPGWNPFLGSDLNSVDRALKRAFARCRIDRRRIAVGGHSDGAGNALTFGLSNGDLFDAVIAIAPAGVVRRLRSSGYRVTYRRFAGGHEVPLGVSQAAIRWFLG
jgi:predicted esterase